MVEIVPAIIFNSQNGLDSKLKKIKVGVDGAQDDKIIKKSIKKGADIIISGSFVFKNKN